MIRWIVTGPTGAGKSAFTRLLADRGALILDGDALGHEILRTETVVRQIKLAFGSEFLTRGAVNRRALGQLVFRDQEALRQLNRITHGPLSALMTGRLLELSAAEGAKLAVLEAAVYFLLPSPPAADLVIAVTASAEIRRQRLIETGLGPADAEARIARQADLDAAFASADIILDNSGNVAELKREADRLLADHGLSSA
jgi:dephospho-CoA kinase